MEPDHSNVEETPPPRDARSPSPCKQEEELYWPYPTEYANPEDTTPSACAGKLRRDVLGWRWSPLLASDGGEP